MSKKKKEKRKQDLETKKLTFILKENFNSFILNKINSFDFLKFKMHNFLKSFLSKFCLTHLGHTDKSKDKIIFNLLNLTQKDQVKLIFTIKGAIFYLYI